jgi:hypothetical protein
MHSPPTPVEERERLGIAERKAVAAALGELLGRLDALEERMAAIHVSSAIDALNGDHLGWE